MHPRRPRYESSACSDSASIVTANTFAYRKRAMMKQECGLASTTLWMTLAVVLLSSSSDSMVNAFSSNLYPTTTATSRFFPVSAVRSTTVPRRSGLRVPVTSSLEVSTCLSALKESTENKKPCSDLEFELHVGKALDTLKKDYQELLTKNPDFSLYNRDVEFVDPSGVTVHGIRAYQNAFRLLHALIMFLYCPEKSAMTNVRMYYCPVKRNIRIHWNAEVIPREIFRGSRSVLYVDGISVYEFDRTTGEIVQHRFEQLIMNNGSVRPKEGVVAALSRYHGVTVPSMIQAEPTVMSNHDLFHVPFNSKFGNNQESLFSSSEGNSVTSSSTMPLYSMEASRSESDGGGDGSSGEASVSGGGGAVDWDALERKNKSRVKFGMKPLTPEEFIRLESHVKAMDAEQRVKQIEQRQQAAAAAAEAEARKRKSSGVMDKFFGNVLKDTCESNFDCERPQVCCDFVFKKMCCSSGSPVMGQEWQPALVPVPVGTEDFPSNQPPPRYY